MQVWRAVLVVCVAGEEEGGEEGEEEGDEDGQIVATSLKIGYMLLVVPLEWAD